MSRSRYDRARGCLETVTSTVHLRAALEAAGVDATGVDDLDILPLVDEVRGSAVHEDFVSRMAQGLSPYFRQCCPPPSEPSLWVSPQSQFVPLPLLKTPKAQL